MQLYLRIFHSNNNGLYIMSEGNRTKPPTFGELYSGYTPMNFV